MHIHLPNCKRCNRESVFLANLDALLVRLDGRRYMHKIGQLEPQEGVDWDALYACHEQTVERIMKKAKGLVEILVSQEVVGLIDGVQKASEREIQDTVNRAALSYIRSDDFQDDVRLQMAESIKDVVVEGLARHLAEVDSRIQKIVMSKYEEVVEKIARDRLDKALAEVKRKI